jgi:phosphonate transport system substrate-binding protein
MAPCAWLPNYAVSVRKTLPETIKRSIKTAILALDKNPPVLKAMDVTGFKPADDTAYDVVRSVL